ncbi:MAG: topoisomerase IV [Ruminococcaceae bacterium]|nr:topoisomerase IV [Oscillospiraceae bacterium]
MAKQRKKQQPSHISSGKAAEVTNQFITDTIVKNFMPYAMYVIRDRAIPEIDGFKPSHRKLLYTMYKMGLLTGARTKSTNVVGSTMKLNPHGDAAIYETLVRLTRGNETLLHPFIDSKGSFGKQYSRDMAYAASRYTEVKLDPFAAELFGGIDKNAVDLIDNYDSTMLEPTLLPTSFPNILVSPNLGIAVGLASNICSFNLGEVCDGAIQLLKSPNTTTEKMLDIIKAPDFAGGALLIYDREAMKNVYETGRGPVKLRARYSYDKAQNCIDVTQIPYSTSIEQIMNTIADLIKIGKIKEITDVRDEIDLNGFKLTIDLRRGTDPDKLMAKLFKLTSLEDNFSCNFNVLIDGSPRQVGVVEILREWIKFRSECVKRELSFELDRCRDKLHLLLGLGQILLDIDKAIKIIRETESDKDVIPNLCEGFSIDEVQAEYIADIKLRHLNREYILNRIQEIESLRSEIDRLKGIIGDELKLRSYISDQLKDIKKKYAVPRKTQIVYAEDIEVFDEEEEIENYPVHVVLTRGGYFKKITYRSLQGNDEHALKDDDEILSTYDTENIAEVLFFSDRAQVYKAKISDFDTTKASALGDYIPAKLGFDQSERVSGMAVIKGYDDGDMMAFIFENGKGVRVSMKAYETKANRKKLTNAYSDASPIVGVFHIKPKEDPDILLVTNDKRGMLIKSSLIVEKSTRSASGVTLASLKGGKKIADARTDYKKKYPKGDSVRKIKLPTTPASMK